MTDRARAPAGPYAGMAGGLIGMLAPWTRLQSGVTIVTYPAGTRRKEGVVIRMLLGGLALGALVLALHTGGGTATASTADSVTQREADLYLIDQIEVKFHRATSHHDINLMMSLWAPGAVFNIDQQTLTGKAQIRHWFLTRNKAFAPGHHWESDTPSYKIRVDVNGDKATMYFECHYIDGKTGTVVSEAGVTHTLQKVNGQWLITNSSGSTATLGP